MKEARSQYEQIQNNVVEWMGRLETSLAERLGYIGEHKSPKEQMAAFDAMQPQDWERMLAEKGKEDTDAFRKEMQRREALQEANRRPL